MVMPTNSENLRRVLGLRVEALLASGPREGEETEVIEKGGGKRIREGLLGHDPREGEETEVIERGGGKRLREAPLGYGPRDGEETEPLEEGDIS